MSEDYLSHHGVAGMHWGHRKAKMAPVVNAPRVASSKSVSTGGIKKRPKSAPVKKGNTGKRVAANIAGSILGNIGAQKLSQLGGESYGKTEVNKMLGGLIGSRAVDSLFFS